MTLPEKPTADDMRQYRKHLNHTQQSLADAMGVHVQTVKYWESGRRNPSRQTVTQLKGLSPRKG